MKNRRKDRVRATQQVGNGVLVPTIRTRGLKMHWKTVQVNSGAKVLSSSNSHLGSTSKRDTIGLAHVAKADKISQRDQNQALTCKLQLHASSLIQVIYQLLS